MVCGSRQVSIYERWKRKQRYEDARKMYRTKNLVIKFGNLSRTTSGRSWSGKKNGQTGRGLDMVQEVFWICETKNWT